MDSLFLETDQIDCDRFSEHSPLGSNKTRYDIFQKLTYNSLPLHE